MIGKYAVATGKQQPLIAELACDRGECAFAGEKRNPTGRSARVGRRPISGDSNWVHIVWL